MKSPGPPVGLLFACRTVSQSASHIKNKTNPNTNPNPIPNYNLTWLSCNSTNATNPSHIAAILY